MAVADSNHEQEWGLIKSGKGREEEKRRTEEEPQFATGAHFLSGTKGRNYEAVSRSDILSIWSLCGRQKKKLGEHRNCDKRCLSGQESPVK